MIQLHYIFDISVRKQSYADNEHYLRKSASVQIIAHEPSRCEGCFDGRLPLLLVVIFIASVIFLLCVGVVVDFQSKLNFFSSNYHFLLQFKLSTKSPVYQIFCTDRLFAVLSWDIQSIELVQRQDRPVQELCCTVPTLYCPISLEDKTKAG